MVYFLFFEQNIDLEEIYNKLSALNVDNLKFVRIKTNTILHNCIEIHAPQIAIYLTFKSIVKQCLIEIGYDISFQLLKVNSREQNLL